MSIIRCDCDLTNLAVTSTSRSQLTKLVLNDLSDVSSRVTCTLKLLYISALVFDLQVMGKRLHSWS
jgi:hypothetical protein